MNKTIYLLPLVFSLSACSGLTVISNKLGITNKVNPQSTIQQTPIANDWHAPLPHDGKLTELQQFWAQYEDPLLLELIAAAQSVSPTIAASNTRIADARTQRISTNANTIPSVTANTSATRSSQSSSGGNQPGFAATGITDTYKGGLQAAWEIDIFGSNKVLMATALRNEQASKSAWHEARVSVAAEMATSYFNQRFCMLQTDILQADAHSKAETARLTELTYNAGFSSQGALALAQASALDATQQLKAQQAQCDAGIKELVALSDWSEPKLREQLSQRPFKYDVKQNVFSIAQLPAEVIMQRPDIDSAQAALMTAASNIKTAQAARLPRVSLNGSIGWQKLVAPSYSLNGETWSLGPLSISLPIFDGGKLKANLQLAEVKYEEQAVIYRNKVRTAVKEVETALVTLHSTQSRAEDVEQSIQSYQQSYIATEHRYQAGFASLIELEESRRYALQAKTNQVNLYQARNNAWISLYRAVGGGWKASQ